MPTAWDQRGDVLSVDVERLLAEQIRYYDDRAEEFDDCYLRRGRFDKGPEFNDRWFKEIARLEAAVQALPISERVLELACGTGLWTRLLVPRADRVVAVDASEQMIGLNRQKVAHPRVEYVRANLFEWEPSGERFDAIFVGFFLSHVPPQRFERFWERMGAWLAPGGLVAFCDNCSRPSRPHMKNTVPNAPSFARRRVLSDGRQYTIVKMLYSPKELAQMLDGLGWDPEVVGTGEHFLYGTATRSS